MESNPNASPRDSVNNNAAKDDVDITHREKTGPHQAPSSLAAVTDDVDEIPANYWYSPRFLGTFFAVGFNLMSSTGGFAVVAPVLGLISQDIGPGPVIWLSLVYTMMLAVGLTLVGQLSDIFGRRWFFICGTALGAVGAAISSRAQTIPVVIGGQTLVGLSASTGYSFAFVIGELVPLKHRFMVNAAIFTFSLPTAGFGAAVAASFVSFTPHGWRGVYYLLIALNGATAVLYFVFYYPPNFRQKHGTDSVLMWIKNYDWVGMFLYVSGLLLFILGLSWGGTVHPWASAAVIAPIIVGFFLLVALFVYEAKVDLKEPLIPIHLFKSGRWLASALLLAVGASVYYSQAIVWPEMVATVYSNGADPVWVGLVGSLVGIAITVGEMIGGAAARHVGKTRWQVVGTITVGTALLGAMAVTTPETPATAMSLMFLAVTAVGWTEAIALPVCTIWIPDQTEIGTAAGIAGSVRSAISTIASTVYSVVLTTRKAEAFASVVPPALVDAGLPESSVGDYMAAAAIGAGPDALSEISGVDEAVLEAGTYAFRVAHADAYRSVFYTSIGFGVVAIVLALFTPNVDDRMTNDVAARLNDAGKKPTEKNDV